MESAVPKSPHQESKKDETPAKAAAVETVAKSKPAKRKEYSAPRLHGRARGAEFFG